MKTIQLVLLSLTLILFSCKSLKKEKAIGIAFVIANGVKLQQKPSLRSSLLNSLDQNTKVEVIARKIPDSNKKNRIFWYKVRSGEKTGFISYREEREKKAFISMHKPAQPITAVITATSLRLRAQPSLTAKVIASMLRGEEVEVLLEGNVNQKIDTKYDTWIQVKRQNGEIGYCYKGYTRDKADIAKDFKNEKITGFVEITNNKPVYLNSPAGRKVREDDPVNCEYHNIAGYPKEGENAPVIAKARVDGKIYYHLEQTYESQETNWNCFSGWVEAGSTTFFQDRFAHTAKKCQDKMKYKKGFYEVINIHNYKSLDVCNVKIEELPILSKQAGETKKAYYKVNGTQVYMKSGQDYMFLKDYRDSRDYTSSITLDFKDIDGDGNYELFTSESNRGGGELQIYTFDGKDFQSIYTQTEGSDDNNINVTLEVKSPLLIEKISRMDGTNLDKKYKLVQNKLVLQK
ncbi:MAG: SH3 domain-containing protein [Spirochaetota bacterium]